MLLGDLNVEILNPVWNDFCNVYNLLSLFKEPICFRNPYNPSCKDLFLKNRLRNIKSTVTIKTNFHKMAITVLKGFYKNQKPKII